MLTQDVIAGRYIMATRPSEAYEIVQQFLPKAKHPRFVQHIYTDATTLFSDHNDTELRCIFISAVYQLYQPLSFLSKITDDGERACGKLPQGVRDEMARLLQLESEEMINYYKSQCGNWMKPQPKGTPERPFRQKVMLLVDRFLPYSINPNDSQTKLF